MTLTYIIAMYFDYKHLFSSLSISGVQIYDSFTVRCLKISMS